MTWRKSIPSPVLWVVWLATRTSLYLPATVPGRIGDVGLYQRWYACRFGAWQLSGGHVALAQDASRLGLVLATAAVIGWRLLIASGRATWRPEFAADAPPAATLLFLVASPVLSPQYLLWPTGLAAACLATGQTTQRPAALAVLAALSCWRILSVTSRSGRGDAGQVTGPAGPAPR